MKCQSSYSSPRLKNKKLPPLCHERETAWYNFPSRTPMPFYLLLYDADSMQVVSGSSGKLVYQKAVILAWNGLEMTGEVLVWKTEYSSPGHSATFAQVFFTREKSKGQEYHHEVCVFFKPVPETLRPSVHGILAARVTDSTRRLCAFAEKPLPLFSGVRPHASTIIPIHSARNFL